MSVSENPASDSEESGGFVVLRRALSTHGVECFVDEDLLEECVRSHIGLRALRGEVKVKRPFGFRQESKSRWYDMIGSGLGELVLVSDAFVRVLKESGATGWSTYPVTVTSKKGEKVPGYHGLSISGRAGTVDWSRSRRVWSPRPVPSGRGSWMRKGLWTDRSGWDGSDVCLPGRFIEILVTDRIASALRRAKLKGIELTPQSRMQYSESNVKWWIKSGYR